MYTGCPLIQSNTIHNKNKLYNKYVADMICILNRDICRNVKYKNN